MNTTSMQTKDWNLIFQPTPKLAKEVRQTAASERKHQWYQFVRRLPQYLHNVGVLEKVWKQKAEQAGIDISDISAKLAYVRYCAPDRPALPSWDSLKERPDAQHVLQKQHIILQALIMKLGVYTGEIVLRVTREAINRAAAKGLADNRLCTRYEEIRALRASMLRDLKDSMSMMPTLALHIHARGLLRELEVTEQLIIDWIDSEGWKNDQRELNGLTASQVH